MSTSACDQGNLAKLPLNTLKIGLKSQDLQLFEFVVNYTAGADDKF